MPAVKNPTSLVSPSGALSVGSNSESMLMLIEDIEKLRKEKNQLARTHETRSQTQGEKINNLQTQLENVKIDLAYQSKRTKECQEEALGQRTECERLLESLESRN